MKSRRAVAIVSLYKKKLDAMLQTQNIYMVSYQKILLFLRKEGGLCLWFWLQMKRWRRSKYAEKIKKKRGEGNLSDKDVNKILG